MALVSGFVPVWTVLEISEDVQWSNRKGDTVFSAAAAVVVFAIYLGHGMFKKPKKPVAVAVGEGGST
jgi:hypothetical protein